LHQDNRRVKMQAQVYRALLLLLSRPGEIISREEVRKWLWPEAFLANLDANVNTTMNKLRQVLGDSPEAPRYIETMPRRGYSFIAAVKFSDQPALQSAGITASAAREAAHSSPEDIPMPVRQRFGAVLRMSGFLIAGILLGALLTFVWFFAQAKNIAPCKRVRRVRPSRSHQAPCWMPATVARNPQRSFVNLPRKAHLLASTI